MQRRAIALLSPAAAAAVPVAAAFALDRLGAPDETAGLVLLLLVAVGASLGGGVAGAAAALAGFVCFSYFFTSPADSLLLARPSGAVALAAFAGTAAGVTRLIVRERRQRRRAENAAERTARLETVAALLARAATRGQVAEIVIEQVCELLDAQLAAVFVLDEGRCEVRAVRMRGYDPEDVAHWNRFATGDDAPVAEAVRRAEPVVLLSREERDRRYPRLRGIAWREGNASVAVPLVVEGRVLGALAVVAPAPRLAPAAGLRFVQALTDLCAGAYERARLFDVERSLRLESERVQAELERMERAQRDFVTNAAHEIRSPLTVIGGAVEILRTGGAEEPEVRNRFLAHIDQQTARLTRLCVSLLTLARIESGVERAALRPTDLRELLEQLADDAELEHARRPSVDADALVVDTEPTLLRHAVANLIRNAFRYGDGAPVEVRAHRRGRDAVVVEVLDRGPGIPADRRARVFDRFDRAGRGDAGGSGLGLAIAERSVTAVGGRVSLAPRPGGGTVGRIVLPLRAEQPAASPTAAHRRRRRRARSHPTRA